MAFTQEFNEHLDWSVYPLFKLNCPSVSRLTICYLHEWRAFNTEYATCERAREWVSAELTPLCSISPLCAIHHIWSRYLLYALCIYCVQFMRTYSICLEWSYTMSEPMLGGMAMAMAMPCFIIWPFCVRACACVCVCCVAKLCHHF